MWQKEQELWNQTNLLDSSQTVNLLDPQLLYL